MCKKKKKRKEKVHYVKRYFCPARIQPCRVDPCGSDHSDRFIVIWSNLRTGKAVIVMD
jgi:hypothetical protein